LLWLLLALVLRLETPSSVKVGQPFAVRVTGAEGSTAALTAVGGQLRGELVAPVVNGVATFPEVRVNTAGNVQLVAVVGNTSVVSPLVVEAPAATLADRTVGYLGLELGLDEGQTVVREVKAGSPAAKAGFEEGDVVDLAALRGPPGPVNMTVWRSSSMKVLKVTREARLEPPVQFLPISFQASMSPFQLRIAVEDDAGQPLAGARVRVELDPAYRDQSVLVFTTDTILSDASGSSQGFLEGVTGEDGVAVLWCRLYNATTPFDVRLTATASYGGNTSKPALSNEFTVYRR